MADRYRSFSELEQQKRLGRDYAIEVIDRCSPIVVMAPHGGGIEPYTSELAALIAGDEHSLYLFLGRQSKDNFRDLHIASHRFDEPKALELVRSAAFVFAVHGHRARAEKFVMTGGGNAAWAARIGQSLSHVGFLVRTPTSGLTGTHDSNICNRGSQGPGVQIELSRAQRDGLSTDPERRRTFVDAVRSVLAEWSAAATR